MRHFYILLALVVAALSGCASTATFVDKASDYSDQSIAAAEFYICRAATVGSVMRNYGNSEEDMEAWRLLCLRQLGAPIAPILVSPAETPIIEQPLY